MFLKYAFKDFQPVQYTPMLDQNISFTDHSGTAATYFYNQDERQSVKNLTDSSGAVVNDYDYTAYGDPIDQLTNGTISQRYTYTGRELNEVSGDYYFRYRMYGAGIGGFLSRDPWKYINGMSMYNGYFAQWYGVDPEGTTSRTPACLRGRSRCRNRCGNGGNFRCLEQCEARYQECESNVECAPCRRVCSRSASGCQSCRKAHGCTTSDWVPPAAGGGISEYIGVEVHLGLYGQGFANVQCCNEEGILKNFVYRKECYGAAFGLGFNGGPVYGLNGKNCRKDRYKGWFAEIGGSLGPISIGYDFGIVEGEDGWPTLDRTFVDEFGIGLSIGFPFQATFCKYTDIGEYELGSCCPHPEL